MDDTLTPAVMFADMLGGWEILLIALVLLLLYGAINLPNLFKGLGRGADWFRKSSDEVQADMERAAEDAGRSVGGIYGKPALEALTTDNQVAELYQIPLRTDQPKPRVKISDKFIVFIAQGFGIGRIPFAPGTWGSVLGIGWAVLLWWMAETRVAAAPWILGLSIPVAVVLCGRAAKVMGDKDPGSVVLDEIIAVPFCFILYFYSFKALPSVEHFLSLRGAAHLLLGFALFRLFDIWKPWPIRQSQSLPGGWGVVVDDLLAAVYVNLVMVVIWLIVGLF
jgi:phosphatidylglycerophosphatase A